MPALRQRSNGAGAPGDGNPGIAGRDRTPSRASLVSPTVSIPPVQYVGRCQLGAKRWISQMGAPPSYFKVAWEQDFEVIILDEDNQAEVIRLYEPRVRVEEQSSRDTAHVRVEGLCDRLIVAAAGVHVPGSISSQGPTNSFDLRHLLPSVGRIADQNGTFTPASSSPLRSDMWS